MPTLFRCDGEESIIVKVELPPDAETSAVDEADMDYLNKQEKLEDSTEKLPKR